MGKIKINHDLLDLYVKKSDYIELETELQRLKVKNEELKKEVKEIGTAFIKKGDYARTLEQESKRLKEENEKLLSKCIDKQCRINELQQICAIKEFSLKVNGKEYKNLSGIDKAKLFINNENAIRDRYIQKLENKMTDLQCKFYENCKKVVDTQKQIDKYRQALQEIRDIVSEPCIVDENCQTCNSGCMQKDILTKINEVIGAEE